MNRMSCIWVCLVLYCGQLWAQTSEHDYQLLIQQAMGGEMEVSVKNGRADLVTEAYAIEIEFAHKWKQSIGQALWYAMQLNKQAGIVLIKEHVRNDNQYVLQLNSALDYAGLTQIRVWVWPDDFPQAATKTRSLAAPTGYWLNTNSNVRHNASCKNYQNTSRGRNCTAQEGRACGICGG